MGQFDTGYFSQGFFPQGFWPQRFWPAPLGDIADWIARELDGLPDPGGSLTLRVVRPGILDAGESHFADSDVFLCGIDEDVKTRTVTPGRLSTALLRLYGIVRELPAATAAGTVLSRVAETIRAPILAGNVAGRACGGLALNIDCPNTGFAPAPGCEMAIVDVAVKYYLEQS